MDCCPKCKSDRGYFFKNTGTYREVRGFHMGCYDDNLRVARQGENAFCINCNGRIKDLDRKAKKSEYYLIIADGKEQGLIPKTCKQKIRSVKNLHGVDLVNAEPEDVKKWGG